MKKQLANLYFIKSSNIERKLRLTNRHQLKIYKGGKIGLYASLSKNKKLIKWLQQEEAFDLHNLTPSFYSSIKYALSRKPSNNVARINSNTHTTDDHKDVDEKNDQIHQQFALLSERSRQYNEILRTNSGQQFEKDVLGFISMMVSHNKPPNNLEVQEYTKLAAKRLSIDPKFDFDDGIWLKMFCSRYEIQQQPEETMMDHHHQQQQHQVKEEPKEQKQKNNQQHDQHEVIVINSDEEEVGETEYLSDNIAHQQHKRKEEEEETRIQNRRKIVASIKNAIQCINEPKTEEEIQFVSTAAKVLLNRVSRLVQEDLATLQ